MVFFVFVTGIYTTMYVLYIQHNLSTRRRVQNFVKVMVFLTYFNAEMWTIVLFMHQILLKMNFCSPLAYA